MIGHIQASAYAADYHGSYIISDCALCGLGSLLGSAASWLPVTEGPVYVYMTNLLYRGRDHNDSSNKFDWFFDQQLYPIPYAIYVGANKESINQSQHNTTEKMVKLRRLASQKWSVKPSLIRAASDYVEDPGSTLGVHYRGTDKGSEVTPTELRYVADLIKNELKSKQFSTVLLATDDDRALAYLLDRFPNLNFFRNHLRGSDECGVHHKWGGYQQAYETMVEMLALGMCKHLLIGRSSIIDVALILARNQTITWQYHN